MRRALFVVNDRPDAGLGHVVRCGALREELNSRGWSVKIQSCDAVKMNYQPDVTLLDIQWSGPRFQVTWPIGAINVMVVDTPRDASHFDLLVCGSAGATQETFEDCGAKRVLAGPDYALLRPEFREKRELLYRCFAHASLVKPSILDLRSIHHLSASDLAASLFCAVAQRDEVITYGGMRASEAACVRYSETDVFRGNSSLTIEPRNAGEELNAKGIMAGAVIDGLGCKRVADEIEKGMLGIDGD